VHRVQQLGVGVAHHLVASQVKQSGHPSVHVDVAAGGNFFDRQTRIQPSHQAEQHRAQRTAVQLQGGRQFTGPV